MRNIGHALARRAPGILLVWGLVFAAFFLGYLVGDRHWFPYQIFDQARVAAWMIQFKVDGHRIREIGARTNYPPADAGKRRVVAEGPPPAGDDSNFLLTGGPGQYLDYCPGTGCTAVILTRAGRLVHAYPYRPDELVSKRSFELPYQQLMHDEMKDTAVFGLAALPGGDLIVVYDYLGTVPQGGGVARIDKDGHVVWYRRDYTHHWPTLTASGEILTVSSAIGESRIVIPLGGRQTFTLECPQGVLEDLVRILTPDGQVVDDIPLLGAIIGSPYRSYLLPSIDVVSAEKNECDPLHANFVRPIGADLAAKLDVAPDDLLVSLHNISSLVVIDRKTHAIKHLLRGNFLFQHSAQPVAGGEIMLFDNVGAPLDEPSRVLVFDPATGAQRTVFPTETTPDDLPVFSRVKGNINVSPDGTRALVAITERDMAYEISLADGTILTTFENLHDLHTLPEFSEETHMVRFSQHGVYYVPSSLFAE